MTDAVSLEQIRPQRFSEVLGQDHVMRVLGGLVARFQADRSTTIPPGLLLSGPPGTGKTTSALIFAHELLGDDFDGNFMELNASNERKIETVRSTIEPFAFHEPSGDAPFKILLLDEFDEMTEPAQNALRRLMEKATGCRFLLTCNHLGKVIDPIVSRCLPLTFRPLGDADIRKVVLEAAGLLGLEAPEELLASIVARSNGQARDALNALTGGDDDFRRFARLEERIGELFVSENGNGFKVAAGSRIEEFLKFCRAEGFLDGEDLVVEIDRVVRSRTLVPPERIRQFTEAIAQTAIRCSSVKVPILQVRSGLYGMLGGI